jgi:hypothetical protein
MDGDGVRDLLILAVQHSEVVKRVVAVAPHAADDIDDSAEVGRRHSMHGAQSIKHKLTVYYSRK